MIIIFCSESYINLSWKINKVSNNRLCNIPDIQEEILKIYKEILINIIEEFNIKYDNFLYYNLPILILFQTLEKYNVKESTEILYSYDEIMPTKNAKFLLDHDIKTSNTDLELLLISNKTAYRIKNSNKLMNPGLYKRNQIYDYVPSINATLKQNFNIMDKGLELFLEDIKPFLINKITNGDYYITFQGKNVQFLEYIQILSKYLKEDIMYYQSSKQVSQVIKNIINNNLSTKISKMFYLLLNQNYFPITAIKLSVIDNLYNIQSKKFEEKSMLCIYDIYSQSIKIGSVSCDKSLSSIYDKLPNYKKIKETEYKTKFKSLFIIFAEIVKSQIFTVQEYLDYISFINNFIFLLSAKK